MTVRVSGLKLSMSISMSFSDVELAVEVGPWEIAVPVMGFE